jgi:hypothetical protein
MNIAKTLLGKRMKAVPAVGEVKWFEETPRNRRILRSRRISGLGLSDTW